MIVLDSGVLIAFLNATDAHHARVRSFLLEHAHESFSVAAMTLAECLVHPVRADALHPALTALMALELDVEDMRQRDAVPLARLCEQTRLKLPDAAVLHTAMVADCSIATTDVALAQAARRVGIVAHELS
jgi:predicted nucleic acid-binding protein